MADTAQTPGTNQPRLIVTDTLGRRIVPLDKPVFSIGRRSESDLRLERADVSRLHAEIMRQGDAFVIHDRQSSFGTFVNDQPVGPPTPVGEGDQVRIGSLLFTFRSSQAAESTQSLSSRTRTRLRP